MKDNTAIHPLALEGKKSGKIRFIHKDGKPHTFYACVSSLTGSRMTWFDSDPPTIDEPDAWIKTVFRDIRAKCEVLEVIGDF